MYFTPSRKSLIDESDTIYIVPMSYTYTLRVSSDFEGTYNLHEAHFLFPYRHLLYMYVSSFKKHTIYITVRARRTL